MFSPRERITVTPALFYWLSLSTICHCNFKVFNKRSNYKNQQNKYTHSVLNGYGDVPNIIAHDKT